MTWAGRDHFESEQRMVNDIFQNSVYTNLKKHKQLRNHYYTFVKCIFKKEEEN